LAGLEQDTLTQCVKSIEVKAVIVRVNGSQEDLGIISSWGLNAQREKLES